MNGMTRENRHVMYGAPTSRHVNGKAFAKTIPINDGHSTQPAQACVICTRQLLDEYERSRHAGRDQHNLTQRMCVGAAAMESRDQVSHRDI